MTTMTTGIWLILLSVAVVAMATVMITDVIRGWADKAREAMYGPPDTRPLPDDFGDLACEIHVDALEVAEPTPTLRRIK